MPFPGIAENDRRTSRKKDRVPIPSVIARPQAVAIRNPCDAEHRPAPVGPERERIAKSGYALLAMTW